MPSAARARNISAMPPIAAPVPRALLRCLDCRRATLALRDQIVNFSIRAHSLIESLVNGLNLAIQDVLCIEDRLAKLVSCGFIPVGSDIDDAIHAVGLCEVRGSGRGSRLAVGFAIDRQQGAAGSLDVILGLGDSPRLTDKSRAAPFMASLAASRISRKRSISSALPSVYGARASLHLCSSEA